MDTTSTEQKIVFVGKNKVTKGIHHSSFDLHILNHSLLHVKFYNTKDRDFLIKCADAENLSGVIQICFFENKESIHIENIEIYDTNEKFDVDTVLTSLVPMFKNTAEDPHTQFHVEYSTLTLNSLSGEQHVIKFNDIKSVSFYKGIYINLIANDKLYRIIASNCDSVYSSLEDTLIINPISNIRLEGIVVIMCTLKEYKDNPYKYSLNGQIYN